MATRATPPTAPPTVLVFSQWAGSVSPGSRSYLGHIPERQSYVTVAAPAGDVGAVLKDGRFHTSSEGGTSMATALTSATAALIRSKYPDMPAPEVVQRIIASCLDVGAPGRDDQTGYGLIRPVRALTGEGLNDVPNPVFTAYDEWKTAQDVASKPATPRASNNDSSSSFPVVPAIAIGIVVLVFGTAVVVRRNGKN